MVDPAVWIVLAAIAAVGLWLYYSQSQYEVVTVKSPLDGEAYVVRNLPDKQAAADKLARIRDRLNKLVTHLLIKFKRMPCVRRLRNKYHGDADRMTESTPDSKYTSYSVNKGEQIFFCLRQRSKKEELVEDDIMMFVAIHELAHVMTESVGHTAEFWHTMAFCLREATNIGIYASRDFAEEPAEYCGVHITDTPRIPIDEIEAEEGQQAESNPAGVPRTTKDESLAPALPTGPTMHDS